MMDERKKRLRVREGGRGKKSRVESENDDDGRNGRQGMCLCIAVGRDIGQVSPRLFSSFLFPMLARIVSIMIV